MYLYTDNQPLSAFDPQGTDIWLEGRSREDGTPFHQKLSIGDPNGAYTSYTWGAVFFPWGNSYIDTIHPHPTIMTKEESLRIKKPPTRPWKTPSKPTFKRNWEMKAVFMDLRHVELGVGECLKQLRVL